MHNEFKTLAYLMKYIENKLNSDMKLNRLMRYLTPHPYDTKSPTYDEGSDTVENQPDITEKLLEKFRRYKHKSSEKCLYCRDNNMERYPIEDMPMIFVHPTFIYFGDKNNNPQGSYLIRFAVTCSAKQREMWDENDIPTDRLFEIGQRISDLFRDKSVEDENIAKLCGTALEFKFTTAGCQPERYSKQTDITVLPITFRVKYVDVPITNRKTL